MQGNTEESAICVCSSPESSSAHDGNEKGHLLEKSGAAAEMYCSTTDSRSVLKDLEICSMHGGHLASALRCSGRPRRLWACHSNPCTLRTSRATDKGVVALLGKGERMLFHTDCT